MRLSWMHPRPAVLCLALVSLLLPTLAWDQVPRLRTAPSTYYVSVAGSDANTCATAQHPGASAKRNLNGASGGIACLKSGDTLLVQNGTYNEQIGDFPDDEHPHVTRPPSGVGWGSPTTIKSETYRGATLNKPSVGPPVNRVVTFYLANTNYVSVEDFVLDARGNGACVWVGPSSHMRLRGNIIKNCGRNGIYGAVDDNGNGGEDIQLLDNEIFNFSIQETGYPGAHAIYFTGSYSLARGNYIHAPCPFYGVHYTSEHGGVHDNIIENNRIQGCNQAGIISQGSNTIIRNNLLENNCIGIYLSSASTKVMNNTVYGWQTAWNCPDTYGIFNKSGNSILQNNLVLQQKAAWSYIYAHNTTHTLVSNLCDASGASDCQLTATASAVVVDGAQGNLQLKANGPAVNAGTATADVPMDRLGVTRPQGSAYDIGAYEYTSTTVPPVEPPVVIPPPTADTTPPTVILTSPATGPISGVVTLIADPKDNVGIAGLQFKLDSGNLGPEITQPPYQYAWNTQATTAGPHTLSVSVRDQANNFGHSAPVSVTVMAAPTVPPPTTGAIICSGQIAAVPGPVSLRCVPEGGTR